MNLIDKMFQLKSKIIVVPARIAGTKAPWMAWIGGIPAIWIPAVHAGMTE